MNKNTYTLKLTSEQEQKLYDTFADNNVSQPAYTKWQMKLENCIITCYQSGKTLFQGKEAYVYASPFLDTTDSSVSTKTANVNREQFPMAGSDEVGTGDYFGPVCVCAAYISAEQSDTVRKSEIRDSKQLSDEDIRKIAPELMKQIPYSLLILDNAKYNQVHQHNNMNAIKAMLHNQAYINLAAKVPLPQLIVVDQFTPEKSYYGYLKHQNSIIRNIHFETKAEDKYIAVGAASVIARYAFLIKMDEMEKTWGMTFTKGASSKVDDCAREFVKKHGMDNLSQVAKLHFKNTERI